MIKINPNPNHKIINLRYNDRELQYDYSFYNDRYIIYSFEEGNYGDTDYGIIISIPSKNLKLHIYDRSGISEDDIKKELELWKTILTENEMEEILECWNLYDNGTIEYHKIQSLQLYLDERDNEIKLIEVRCDKDIIELIKFYNDRDNKDE